VEDPDTLKRPCGHPWPCRGSPWRSHGARIASRCGTTGIRLPGRAVGVARRSPDLSRLPARSISAYAADL